MLKTTPRFIFTLTTLLLAIFLFPSIGYGQTDLSVNGTHTVSAGTTEEYNNVFISTNNSTLVVNGTLLVNGNLDMSANKSNFIMGPDAVVIIYGDFTAANQANIKIAGYLIIQGNFIKDAAGTQGSLIVNDGKIYIFGTAANWPVDFASCGDAYDGNTTTTAETCDYGTQTSYEDNYDSLPSDVTSNLDCFDLNPLLDQTVCRFSSATYSIDQISGVNYEWEEKIPGGDWTSVGTNQYYYTINNTTLSMSGNQYRVKLRNTDPTASCTIVISDPAILTVSPDNNWAGSIDADWNKSGNWECNYIPDSSTNAIIPAGLSNYPILSNGAEGTANDIIIESGASLEVNSNTLNIYGSISNNGTFDAQQGSIEMKGSIPQSIPSNVFLNDKVGNLSINNPAGVSLLGNLGVSGTFSALQGTFDTGNFFTLLSDASQTALIDTSGSGQINGLVTMQRYLDSGFGYKYFSSPFSNSLVGDFSSYIDLNAAFPQLYSYNENREDSQNQDATGWEAYTSPSASLNIMEGYALNFGNSTAPVTVELSGNVNNGPLNIGLNNNNGKYTKGFNLVGNPYPSPIDWDASGWTKTNIDNGIYFFTASGSDQYSGIYTSYVNGISTGSGASSIIPSMQGFFVHVSDQASYPVSASLGVTNAVRVNDFSRDFYKSAVTEKKEQNSLMRLEAGFEDSQLKDAAVIYFSNFAQNSFEKDKDALKLMNTDTNVPSIYSLSPEKNMLSINGMQGLNGQESVRIPLGINIEKEGWITIRLSKNSVPVNYIYLLDKEKRTGQELSKNPDFKFHAKSGNYQSRFELVFSRTRITNPSLAFNEPLSIDNKNGALKVSINLEQAEDGLLRMSTTSGQLLYSKEVSGKENIEINGIKSSGVYIFSLKTTTQNYSKKVLIKD